MFPFQYQPTHQETIGGYEPPEPWYNRPEPHEEKWRIQPHQLSMGRRPRTRACKICDDQFHHTDVCPQLQDPDIAEIYDLGGYGPPRPRCENHANNNYTPRWQGRPNYRWNSQEEEGQYYPQQQQYYCPQFQPQPQAPQPSASTSLEDMLKTLAEQITIQCAAVVQANDSKIAKVMEAVKGLTQ